MIAREDQEEKKHQRSLPDLRYDWNLNPDDMVILAVFNEVLHDADGIDTAPKDVLGMCMAQLLDVWIDRIIEASVCFRPVAKTVARGTLSVYQYGTSP